MEALRSKIDRDMDEARQIIEEHDHVVNEMRTKRREMDEALETMSNLDKKNKRTIQQLEEKVRGLTIEMD